MLLNKKIRTDKFQLQNYIDHGNAYAHICRRIRCVFDVMDI